MKLLNPHELPKGMLYPPAFIRLVKRQIVNLEPWWILDAGFARGYMEGLAQRYPATHLVPFAKRGDNDDVACFELESPGNVVIVHDFSSSGWERREVFDDVHGWLRRAVEDMIEFDSMEDG